MAYPCICFKRRVRKEGRGEIRITVIHRDIYDSRAKRGRKENEEEGRKEAFHFSLCGYR